LALEALVMNALVSYYGPGFDGCKTANGERFQQQALTCASRTLPFNTRLQVSCSKTGRKVVVRVNDRGPYVGNRVLDLSLGAFKTLAPLSRGVLRVNIHILSYPLVQFRTK
jgi:rare lipoprotein A